MRSSDFSVVFIQFFCPIRRRKNCTQCISKLYFHKCICQKCIFQNCIFQRCSSQMCICQKYILLVVFIQIFCPIRVGRKKCYGMECATAHNHSPGCEPEKSPNFLLIIDRYHTPHLTSHQNCHRHHPDGDDPSELIFVADIFLPGSVNFSENNAKVYVIYIYF